MKTWRISIKLDARDYIEREKLLNDFEEFIKKGVCEDYILSVKKDVRPPEPDLKLYYRIKMG